jgi:hypothetical protein
MDNVRKLAERFHDTYERLAPEYGYETRQETRVFDPDSPNGQLMQATCRAILAALTPASDGRAEGLREAAGIAYRVCAETRHVTLGRKCEDAILARAAELEGKTDE